MFDPHSTICFLQNQRERIKTDTIHMNDIVLHCLIETVVLMIRCDRQHYWCCVYVLLVWYPRLTGIWALTRVNLMLLLWASLQPHMALFVCTSSINQHHERHRLLTNRIDLICFLCLFPSPPLPSPLCCCLVVCVDGGASQAENVWAVTFWAQSLEATGVTRKFTFVNRATDTVDVLIPMYVLIPHHIIPYHAPCISSIIPREPMVQWHEWRKLSDGLVATVLPLTSLVEVHLMPLIFNLPAKRLTQVPSGLWTTAQYRQL
jgi:hypothetical protein